jgi:hypothetical protein
MFDDYWNEKLPFEMIWSVKTPIRFVYFGCRSRLCRVAAQLPILQIRHAAEAANTTSVNFRKVSDTARKCICQYELPNRRGDSRFSVQNAVLSRFLTCQVINNLPRMEFRGM